MGSASILKPCHCDSSARQTQGSWVRKRYQHVTVVCVSACSGLLQQGVSWYCRHCLLGIILHKVSADMHTAQTCPLAVAIRSLLVKKCAGSYTFEKMSQKVRLTSPQMPSSSPLATCSFRPCSVSFSITATPAHVPHKA